MSLALSRSFARVAYVGAATVGASAWWFMESSEGPKLNYWHLVSKHIIHTYLISLSLSLFLSLSFVNDLASSLCGSCYRWLVSLVVFVLR